MSLDSEDKQWISEQMSQMSEHVDQQIRVMSEKIEKVETSLLTEFHKWASPTEARLRTHTATMRAVDLEMEALSERVQKLEDRQQQP